METPSSASSSTSQTASSATSMSWKMESAKKPQQKRSALIDITNDSPIIGLAIGSLETPLTGLMSKKKRIFNRGSGEALLRGQVKTLLQKVVEEIDGLRPTTTMMNTPRFLNPSFVNVDRGLVSQIDNETVTRTLAFDFSDNSDSSGCYSVVTHNGASKECPNKVSFDDYDDTSDWSIRANASSSRDDDDDGVLIDELCEGISNLKEGPECSRRYDDGVACRQE